MNDCPIKKLADDDLARIFKRLPPFERLKMSEVCLRWQSVISLSWLWFDITELNLNSRLYGNLGLLVRLCPNLQSIFAQRQTFQLDYLEALADTRIRDLTLTECAFKVSPTSDVINERDDGALSSSLQHVTSLQQLVLNDVYLIDRTLLTRIPFPFDFPASSLTRLQLSDLKVRGTMHNALRLSSCLSELRNLECLILHGVFDDDIGNYGNCEIYHGLEKLKNLRELGLGHSATCGLSLIDSTYVGWLIFELPRLEVLFLDDLNITSRGGPPRLITRHAALRILVISGLCLLRGEDGGALLSSGRVRHPKGPDSPAIPVLNMFLGKMAAKRFDMTSTEATIMHTIDRPLQKFLEKEEIAVLFEGVWIAEMVLRGAKYGCELWSGSF